MLKGSQPAAAPSPAMAAGGTRPAGRRGTRRTLKRAVISAGAFLLFSAAALNSAREGLAELLRDEAARAGSAAALETARRLSPHAPDAAYDAAVLLLNDGRAEEAAEAFGRAAALRPRDYFLWLELAGARDRVGDGAGALAAFDRAVALAPSYAQPLWQRGNLLFRLGEYERAFDDMRRASEADPQLFAPMLELAWVAYGETPELFLRAATPRTGDAGLQLASFLAQRGLSAEAMRLSGTAARAASPRELRRALGEMLASGKFKEAHALWSAAHAGESFAAGGFEVSAPTDEPGFGWRSGAQPNVRLGLADEPGGPGRPSLEVEFKGNSNPLAPAVSKLATVEPGARYRLRFFARTRELKSGGMPVLQVHDARDDARPLAQAPALPVDSPASREYAVEFSTGADASAVTVSLRRQRCGMSPCPAFGTVWLGGFSLTKL